MYGARYTKGCVKILTTIILTVLILGVLITVHELGHYSAARIFKVSIREFAIGMGPKILRRTSKKTGIVYSLRLFPIGGFVNMVGEDESADVNDQGALSNKPVWQRMIITVSGAVMNLVLGILIMSIVILSTPTLGSTTIIKFNEETAVSSESGLMVGDEIYKIKNSRVHIANELVYEIMRNGTEPVEVTVIRNGQKIVVYDVNFPVISSQGHDYGKVDFYVNSVPKNFITVITHSYFQSISSMKMIWQSFSDLIGGKYGLEDMSGPVGVTTAVGEAKEAGGNNLLYLSAIITLNLGIFNLLPLPALDGGRLIFQIIELIRRKPIKPEYEGYVHFAGIVLLMMLMLVVTYQDIIKLFGVG
jgi:Predicted membrane-associated Zn-dependent proteases 1